MTTSMTIRMDPNVKQPAQELFRSLGLDMTTAINIFLRQALIHNGLPFKVTYDRPTEKTWQALRVAENDTDIHGPLATVDEMMEDLNSDD